MEASVYNLHSELVIRCKSGDESAFNLLYRKYCRQMFSIAMRILQNHTTSEDILQESFTAAFEKIHTFSGDVSFGAWIKRIVINKSLNELKKKKLQFADEATDLPDDPYEDHAHYPELSVDQIQKGVVQLPEGYRVVLSLYLFDKLSHREIADQLGITESTSKSQYNRAKKKLKQILLENYEQR